MSSTSNNLSYEGIGGLWVSFCCPDEIAEGLAVKVSAENTVSLCDLGDQVDGVVLAWANGYATVQVAGFATLAVSGDDDVTVGRCTLFADGDGGVYMDEDGISYLVVSSTGTAATILL